jgi:hypothetical protein
MHRVLRGRLYASVAVGLLLAFASASARAGSVLFTVAVGYNGVPAISGVDPQLTPLRFADDDAVAVHELGRALSRRSFLLTLPDRETSERFRGLVGDARPPSLRELERVIDELNVELAKAERAGEQTSVILFYSGHGTLGDNGEGSLALLDGVLTREDLYERILARLHARIVHVLVDACHAESVVRPRDSRAVTTAVSGTTAAAYVAGITLGRFPNVGAIVSSASAKQAHEWELYQGGVFTHEVLSGLRGAADVNGDHQVEYSELAAFLAAANRSVADPRARLDTVVRPPSVNPRAPIVDLGGARGFGHLKGRPAALGAFFIEDAAGVRLVDLRAEPGFLVDVALPPTKLFLRNGGREVELRLDAEETVAFESLVLEPAVTAARGAIASSLHQGLFATRFGPSYYTGFVDRAPELVSVDLPGASEPLERSATPRAHRLSSWVAAGAGILGVSAAVLGGMALEARSEYNDTKLANPSALVRERYDHARYAGLGCALSALVAGGVAWWLRSVDQ